MLRFFASSAAAEEDFKVSRLTSLDIAHILSHATENSLFILDIDDTIGRVSTSIGQDAWFRFRMQQFIEAGHSQSDALREAVIVYNLVQLASTTMVPVDEENHIAPLLEELKAKGAKVIGLTARSHELTDKTLELLGTLGVSFSPDVLQNAEFLLNDKLVVIKNGVIFANGNNKGQCLEKAKELAHVVLEPDTFAHVHFADDSKRNCDHVAESLEKLGVKSTVWHYPFAEERLGFDDDHKARAAVQEEALRDGSGLLPNADADMRLSQRRIGL